MLSVSLIVLATLFRIIPHPWNFSPIGGAAVLAGRTMPLSVAVATVIVATLVGNGALSLVHGGSFFFASLPFQLAGFAAYVLLARAMREIKGGALAAASAGAVGFFLISNFGVWASGYYGLTWAGLMTCYAAAVPFFAATLIGDLVWTAVLCLAYQGLKDKGGRLPAWVFAQARDVRAL